jgi:hypothetical protein
MMVPRLSTKLIFVPCCNVLAIVCLLAATELRNSVSHPCIGIGGPQSVAR